MKPSLKMASVLMTLAIFSLATVFPAWGDVLAGTVWTPTLTYKFKVVGDGGSKSKGPCRLEFHEGGTFTLTLVDIPSQSVSGTYLEQANGRITLAPDVVQLESFLLHIFSEGFQLLGQSVPDLWVNVLEGIDYSTVKRKNNRLQLKIKNRHTFEIGGTLNSVPFQLTATIFFSGIQGVTVDPPDELAGTNWQFDTIESGWLNKFGKSKEPWFLDLHFGPNVDLGLLEGECLIDDSFATYRGTYSRSGNRGVVKFGMGSVNWTALLSDRIDTELTNNGMTISDIAVALRSNKVYATLKKDLLILNAQSVFRVHMLVDGSPVSTAGKFAIKGKGTQLVNP